jgi:pectin lyase
MNGATGWSATCNGLHYWNLYFTGSNDLVTLQKNYIHHTSGRAPKVGGNTLLHAVNNYFYSNSDHAFEADQGAKIVAEGNVFQNVKLAQQAGLPGKLFNSASSPAACKQYLGHECQQNAYGSSGALTGTDASVLSGFSGKNVAGAGSAESAKGVQSSAGYGKI